MLPPLAFGGHFVHVIKMFDFALLPKSIFFYDSAEANFFTMLSGPFFNNPEQLLKFCVFI